MSSFPFPKLNKFCSNIIPNLQVLQVVCVVRLCFTSSITFFISNISNIRVTIEVMKLTDETLVTGAAVAIDLGSIVADETVTIVKVEKIKDTRRINTMVELT